MLLHFLKSCYLFRGGVPASHVRESELWSLPFLLARATHVGLAYRLPLRLRGSLVGRRHHARPSACRLVTTGAELLGLRTHPGGSSEGSLHNHYVGTGAELLDHDLEL